MKLCFNSSSFRVRVVIFCMETVQVASYEFTTLTCVPGVIKYRGSKIQVRLKLSCMLSLFRPMSSVFSCICLIPSESKYWLDFFLFAASGPSGNYWRCERRKGSRSTGDNLNLAQSSGCWCMNFYINMLILVQVISTARTCNCILIVLDAIKPITHKRLIEKELEGFGIR